MVDKNDPMILLIILLLNLVFYIILCNYIFHLDNKNLEHNIYHYIHILHRIVLSRKYLKSNQELYNILLCNIFLHFYKNIYLHNRHLYKNQIHIVDYNNCLYNMIVNHHKDILNIIHHNHFFRHMFYLYNQWSNIFHQ